MMGAFTQCCRGCKDRWVSDTGRCHTTCEKYLKAQEEWLELKDKQRKEKNRDTQYLSYKIDVKEKNRRRFNK